MSLGRPLGFAALLIVCCPWSGGRAGVFVGVGFPGPGYYRPYGCCHRYGWGCGGFYRPYGFGVAVVPAPVVVGAAPVVVQQPTVVQQPVVVQPAYAPPPAQAPAPLPAPTPVSTPDTLRTPDVMTAAASGTAPADIDSCLRQLRDGDEQERADALVQLGRLRAQRAIGPMVKALNSDASAKVREAAARGLGLIGSSTALGALQYAAQADSDPEVRHSAGFAAETIRDNRR
jgi:hypothetical protein